MYRRVENCQRKVSTYSDRDVEFLSEVTKQISLVAANLQAYEEIACLKARLEIENTYLQDEIRTTHNFKEILGNSLELLKLLDRVEAGCPDRCQRFNNRRNREWERVDCAGDP